MFKLVAVVGGLMAAVGAVLGLWPVSEGSYDCGSPFFGPESGSESLTPGEFGQRKNCLERRDSREGPAVFLLVVGAAGLLGGTMGVIADRDRDRDETDPEPTDD